jgi:NAD(P)-dependent dehydrogenase (short-subunit alcohol dehydrogenase family)
MAGRLNRKVCLLMGGGSASTEGIPSNGQAVGVTFGREGAKVAVVDMNLKAAEETAHQIVSAGGSAIALRADASKHADVQASVVATMEKFGRIDVLHNNVGIEAAGGVVETSEADWDKVHAVNLKSVFLTCKEVVPLMQKQGGGVITNVSSTASLRWGAVEYIAYNSSKAALNHMSRIMARQYAPQNIRCNVIVPGLIDTPHVRALYVDKAPEELQTILAARNVRAPMGRQGTPWEIANAALFLASDDASYVSGLLMVVDGALSC